MNILYVNHGINEINLKSILKDQEVIDCLPVPRETPIITYKYSNAIRSKIPNYKQTTMELYSTDNTEIIPYNCEESSFINHLQCVSRVVSNPHTVDSCK